MPKILIRLEGLLKGKVGVVTARDLISELMKSNYVLKAVISLF